MKYILCILIGYILGNINTAYIIGKIKGFDIRTKGSENAGASNATITMGWRIGALVAICDILKAFISVLICKMFFPEMELAGIIGGVSCVLGHIFPFYLKFHGGKGFASYLGLILALDWKFFLIICGVVIIITVITDYIALGTLTTVITYPIYLTITTILPLIPIIAAIASVVIILKHINNIKKIISGKEIGLRSAKMK